MAVSRLHRRCARLRLDGVCVAPVADVGIAPDGSLEPAPHDGYFDGGVALAADGSVAPAVLDGSVAPGDAGTEAWVGRDKARLVGALSTGPL